MEEEIEFAGYYLFLQKLRFENAFLFEFNVDESNFKQLLPPLSLQVLLENAFKHNSVSLKNPLHIKINAPANSKEITVSNNIQLKSRIKSAAGVGFENLINRYRLICEQLPYAEIKHEEYIVTLPLIAPE